MTLDADHVPETLEECFVQLKDFLDEDPDGGAEFMGTDDQNEDVTYMYHHGLGRWIRNNWGLWKQEGPLYDWLVQLGLHHADDMSCVLLKSFWRHLHDKPLDIEGQVKYYQDYWERAEKTQPTATP